MTEQQAIETYKPTVEESHQLAEQQPIYSGRTIPLEYVPRIIDTARILQSTSTPTEDLTQKLEEITSHLWKEIRDNRVSIEGARRFIQERENIDTQFVERAIDLYFPSKKQIIDDIQVINSRMTDSATKNYFRDQSKRIEEALLNDLKVAFPLENFLSVVTSEQYDGELSRSSICQTSALKRKTLFKRREVIKNVIEEDLADLYMFNSASPNGSISLTIRNPRFTRACINTLQYLKEEISKEREVNIYHDYFISDTLKIKRDSI